jgi:alkyl sulfatase BDS1-like metallo-beta-lactamase superfamily hydrolase
LNFSDKSDFEDAARSLRAQPEKLTIKNANGRVICGMESHKAFIGGDEQALKTVDPSPWRVS